MTAKITLVASQTPKEVIREIIREPAVIPTQSRHHSLAHAISISNDDSSLSSGQLKSIEEIPNLAALLKKILKSRKVHYSESAPKQAEAELNEKKKVKEANVRSGSISKHIERLEAELYEKKRLLKKEVKAEGNIPTPGHYPPLRGLTFGAEKSRTDLTICPKPHSILKVR